MHVDMRPAVPALDSLRRIDNQRIRAHRLDQLLQIDMDQPDRLAAIAGPDEAMAVAVQRGDGLGVRRGSGTGHELIGGIRLGLVQPKQRQVKVLRWYL